MKKGVYGLALILALHSSGCTTLKIAERGFYRKILNKPYKRHVYDCSDKTMDYHNRLLENGYESTYHIGKVDDLIMADDERHAWVTYKDKDGIERLVDPTRREINSGLPVKCYPQYHSEIAIDRCFRLIEKCDDLPSIESFR